MRLDLSWYPKTEACRSGKHTKRRSKHWWSVTWSEGKSSKAGADYGFCFLLSLPFLFPVFSQQQTAEISTRAEEGQFLFLHHAEHVHAK